VSGVFGKDVPLPGEGTGAMPAVVGARRLEILNRVTALIRFRVDGGEVTYLVQHSRGIAPERSERRDGGPPAPALAPVPDYSTLPPAVRPRPWVPWPSSQLGSPHSTALFRHFG
jgi:hypothetical protein